MGQASIESSLATQLLITPTVRDMIGMWCGCVCICSRHLSLDPVLDDGRALGKVTDERLFESK
eukprot:515790-Amorphochlora_amoeboformis.AAC.1